MKKWKLSIVLAPAAIAVGIGAIAIAQGTDNSAQVKRGEYLVTVGGCNDCHTPKKMGPMGPEPDMSRKLMGHPALEIIPPIPTDGFGMGKWMAATNGHLSAWAGPWGVSFAANLTPDNLTGSGAWTEKSFMDALRTGKHLGTGRPILPPMPWPNYGQMTDEDLKAIFAYLRSIPAISNQVPQPIPPPASGH
ncbi:MAG: c-type cytochrome [Candidatus Zixiibacteriota bacterium]